jgi:hypothetical protein
MRWGKLALSRMSRSGTGGRTKFCLLAIGDPTLALEKCARMVHHHSGGAKGAPPAQENGLG